jgi:hypothetical protein
MSKVYNGINIQWPISEDILKGIKTIETRTYPIPEKYINCEMLLIETPGKSGNFVSRITGIIQFTACKAYKNKKEFYLDKSKHLVEKDSPWAWKDKPKWGWQVKVIKKFKKPITYTGQKGIIYTRDINLSSLL